MARILFVEDEPAVLDTLTRFFGREGFTVFGARSRGEAVDILSRLSPDVAVLDVMLNEGPEPEHDGFEVCRALRDGGYKGPVIFVTARTAENDKLLGFKLGADDYVTKPFSVKELAARITAVLRRAGGARSSYRFGAVEVDLDNYLIRHADGEERLSNREQELLRYLIEHRGKVLPREELLTGIWKYSPNVTTRTVDTHILNVRKKLRDDAGAPRFIETMHGVGYRFVGEEGMKRSAVLLAAAIARSASAAEGPEQRHDRLHDLLLRQAAYGEDVVPALRTLAEALPAHDLSRNETLYWLAKSEYERGHVEQARRWLRDAIRSAGPMRERSLALLCEMELDQSGVQSLPVRWSFDTPAHGLVHPETAEEGGSVRIDTTTDPRNPSLAWSPRNRSGNDALMVGFRHVSHTPKVVRFRARTLGANARISAEFLDVHGQRFAVSPRGTVVDADRWITIEWRTDETRPATGATGLDLRLLDRLEIHAALVGRPDADMSSTLFSVHLDDFEVE